jgi:starvation-inducible DNA-binding protein
MKNGLGPTKLDIEDDVRLASIASLQARLAMAIDLEAQLKHAHWNVRGRNFFQLHQLFDQIHGEIEQSVDTIAERIAALRGIPDGRLQTVTKTTTLEEYPANARTGEDHLRAVCQALARFAKAARVDVDESSHKGDADTADIFTEVSRAAGCARVGAIKLERGRNNKTEIREAGVELPGPYCGTARLFDIQQKS